MTPRYSLATRLALCLGMMTFAAVLGADAQQIATDLSGKLVSLKGKRTQPVTESSIGGAKYIAFYYGAGWCGPCHQFTPSLVSFYNEMKPKYPGFEVVFVSHDTSEPEMEKYMAEMSMPWPALRFSAVHSSHRIEKYCGPGIPCLVVVNEKGEVVADSYQGTTYVGPSKVMRELAKLLGEGPAAPAPAVAAASVAPQAKPASSSGAKSATGTDWDKVFKKP